MLITVGEYLLQRLKQMGIGHIFGVPGDFNLLFLDQVVNFKGIKWIGTCNELNGAYASDGYARIKGIGALITTFGVGELSAINGIAGAYAECIPIINIVGMPSLQAQAQKAILHHTLGDGDFSIFAKMFQHVSAAQVLLGREDTAEHIDTALLTCLEQRKPIYIGLPADIVELQVAAPEQPLVPSLPNSDPKTIQKIVTKIAYCLKNAKKPLILIDAFAYRYQMLNPILDLVDASGLPFAMLPMAKGMVPENHPQFIGRYMGNCSTPGVKDKVENADCLLLFGTLLSDFNIAGFSPQFKAQVTIEVKPDAIKINDVSYPEVRFAHIASPLMLALKPYKARQISCSSKLQVRTSSQQAISHQQFWQAIPQLFNEDSIILVETGTSLFGLLDTPLPVGAHYVSQPLWGCIGYTLGALLGICLAAPDKQSILFIGDGAFQVSAQELSTIIHLQLKPIIFLLNNAGYTSEKIIHGPNQLYNQIHPWHYTEFATTFGGDLHAIRVSNMKELTQAFDHIDTHKNEATFIEVIMDALDSPVILQQLIQSL